MYISESASPRFSQDPYSLPSRYSINITHSGHGISGARLAFSQLDYSINIRLARVRPTGPVTWAKGVGPIFRARHRTAPAIVHRFFLPAKRLPKPISRFLSIRAAGPGQNGASSLSALQRCLRHTRPRQSLVALVPSEPLFLSAGT